LLFFDDRPKRSGFFEFSLGIKKLGKNRYTLLIASPKGRQAKKVTLLPCFLKAAAGFLLLILSLFSLVLYDYFKTGRDVIDLDALLEVNRSQRNEIQSFIQKISMIEGEISKLKAMETQVKKEWLEVQEISKKTKITPVTLVQRGPICERDAQALNTEAISVLEDERPQVINQVHADMLLLRQETLTSEKKLEGLKETLRRQKSVLLATPSLWPVFGRITSGFGETRHLASSGGTKPHKGIDIAAPIGTPVVAPASGVVHFSTTQEDYGNLIELDHGHGFVTRFGHLQKMFIKAGKSVRKGDPIGTVGMSGFSNGPHLHYEIHLNGPPVNPYAYLTETP
jgi:murein DD-endopeptidase MepM/ murein hydrolase activator NlpD